jgi:hypothetical protein
MVHRRRSYPMHRAARNGGRWPLGLTAGSLWLRPFSCFANMTMMSPKKRRIKNAPIY